MRTINDRNRAWVFGVLSAVLVGLLAAMACQGAPRTPQQFEEMSEEDFEDWLTRVHVWARIAGDQVARAHPEDVLKILSFCDILATMAGNTDPLSEAASQAGLSSPIVAVLVLEAKALLNARGGLPEGRTQELLRTVADGARAGATR